MTIQGQTFQTATQVHTDISAGGNFNFITFKKKLYFNFDGQAELTWSIVNDQWSWTGLFFDEKYIGLYDKSQNEYNTFNCKLQHITKDKTINMTCLFLENRQLLCNVTFKENGNTFYQNEIYELTEDK